ncbi:unnamed protein product [Protopolystoma xenopodis]|uniref:TFIIS N-terminal domain-containing protein n=1 Tax=Protopolystoma xenopodis TaxID=117903 RepID=A0A448XA74_9PLAT|nr:unnamed protein product [Protopolystoma xenopodis]
MQRVSSDPDKLLDAYKDHLNDNGGVLKESVRQLIALMLDTRDKLVPKCLSLCIIAASEIHVQAELCREGAWDILLKWLQEALKEENYAFLIELLNVYLNLPVGLDQLTQNVCPKLINTLSKRCENETVRALAGEIVKKWKQFTAEPPNKKKKEELPNKVVNKMPDEIEAKSEQKKRTVKKPPTVMRTAGIEEVEAIQPKSRSEVMSKRPAKPEPEKVQIEPIESFHQKIIVNPGEPKKGRLLCFHNLCRCP